MKNIEGTITRISPPTYKHDARALARCPALMSPQNPTGTVAFSSRAWRSNKVPQLGQRVVLNRLEEISCPSEPRRRWAALEAVPAPNSIQRPPATKALQQPNTEHWFVRLLGFFGINGGAKATN
jgi:hypothetical protein